MTAPQAEASLRDHWIMALRSAPLQGNFLWTPATFAVAVALWMFSSEDGGSIRPGDARVAAIVGCGMNHVRRKRRDLLKLGMIECLSEATANGVAPVFRLVAPDAWRIAGPGTEEALAGVAEEV